MKDKIEEWTVYLMFALALIFGGYIALEEFSKWEPDEIYTTAEYSQHVKEMEKSR